MEKRETETLEEIISGHAQASPEATIISDGWAAYDNLENKGFIHQLVIHEREFKNDDVIHTNSIENIWSQLKTWIYSMHGLNHTCCRSYIAESIFRYKLLWRWITRWLFFWTVRRDCSSVPLQRTLMWIILSYICIFQGQHSIMLCK